MRLSKKSEYALSALICLARDPSALHTIPAISKREKIPAKFLEQILLTLRHANLVSSRRGAGGGYFLEMPPSKLRVWDVVRIMEEFPAPTRAGRSNEGHYSVLDSYLGQLSEDLQALLCQTTLEDLIKLEQHSQSASFDI